MGRIRQFSQSDTPIVASSKRSRGKTLVFSRDNQYTGGRKETAGARMQNAATRLLRGTRYWAKLLPCFMQLKK